MIYGVKIAVHKDEIRDHGEALWSVVEDQDILLRQCGIEMIIWTIFDLGSAFMVIAMIPGDSLPELRSAHRLIKAGLTNICSGGLTLKSVERPDSPE